MSRKRTFMEHTNTNTEYTNTNTNTTIEPCFHIDPECLELAASFFELVEVQFMNYVQNTEENKLMFEVVPIITNAFAISIGRVKGHNDMRRIGFYDGNVYVGCFNKINNSIEGRGRLEFSNGVQYVGYFQQGYANGTGKIFMSNGRTFHGIFVNGYINGAGRYSDGHRHIYGTFYQTDNNNVYMNSESNNRGKKKRGNNENRNEDKNNASSSNYIPPDYFSNVYFTIPAYSTIESFRYNQ